MDTKEHSAEEHQLWDFIINLKREDGSINGYKWSPVLEEADRLGLNRSIAVQMMLEVAPFSDESTQETETKQEPAKKLAATAAKPLPAFKAWDDLEEQDLPELKIILDGVFNQGAKMTLGGDSKAGKTWLLMYLAFSIATGQDWLGIKTHKGSVLYVNCELHEQFFKKRGQSIKRAMDVEGLVPNLVTWTTRGHFLTAEAFKEAILERIGDQKFDVIIIDPLYKLLNGADANSAGEMQKILSELEQIAERAGAGLVYGDHFAKGNSAGKKAVDRISGSGVTARDPDAILTLDLDCTDDRVHGLQEGRHFHGYYYDFCFLPL